jgi:hypothetical protein
MDQDTNTIIIGFAVLGPLALACLITIGVTTARFIRSEKAADVSTTDDGRDNAGRKAHRVNDAALSSA